VGNIVIGRLTGGLAKVRHCAYLYEWLDLSDPSGEVLAFFGQIRAAIDTYRHDRARHWELMREAMSLDATWDKSAEQYVHMYRYGLLLKSWRRQQQKLITTYLKSLKDEQAIFTEFFIPGLDGYSSPLDWALYHALKSKLTN